MPSLDSAISSLLSLSPSIKSSITSISGGDSSARAFRVTTTEEDGTRTDYFLKTGKGDSAATMFAGEHASLSAINSVVPTLCPKSFGHGEYKDSPGTFFLLTQYLDRSSGTRRGDRSTGPSSLAHKLAKLHTTPAPILPGHSDPQFGFPIPTCCGNTQQSNTFTSSWADFYADHRLRFIAREANSNQGSDPELANLIEDTCTQVIPRLLSTSHLNQGRGITPVVVHGDLWSGNTASGTLPGMTSPEDIIFDSSACYAHSEYELGIMKMFGGFGGSFLSAYHDLVPKTEPVEEYEDRVRLYELYHHLNHHAMFGGGYRSGAVSIMRDLIRKYGKGSRGS